MPQCGRQLVTVLADALSARIATLGRRAAAIEDQFAHSNFDADEAINALDDEHDAIMGQLAKMPARSLDALRIKAERVVRYAGITTAPQLDRDVELALSIIRDILAMDDHWPISTAPT